MKQHTNIRIDEDLKKSLTLEAEEQHRSFTNYVELLLKTHPGRNNETEKLTAGFIGYKKK